MNSNREFRGNKLSHFGVKCDSFFSGESFLFLSLCFNTKPYQLKKQTIQISIYIFMKSKKYAGLLRDRASGRMLILQEFLQFPFEHGNRGTPSYF